MHGASVQEDVPDDVDDDTGVDFEPARSPPQTFNGRNMEIDGSRG